jgi:hypothetical protein
MTSHLRRKTSKLEGEEVSSVVCRLVSVSRNLRDRRQNLIWFSQIHAQFVTVDLNIWRENATWLLIEKSEKKYFFSLFFKNDEKK